MVLAVTLGGCRRAEQLVVGEPEEASTYTAEDFLDTTQILGGWFSPDGSHVLISSDETGVFNAFALPVNGESAVRLTDSKNAAIRVVSYFPADQRFLYVSDGGGDELPHLFVRELDGTTVDLSPGHRHKAEFLGWAQDDRSFFLSSNERDERYFDIFEVQTDGYDRRRAFRDTLGYQFGAVSPNKRFIALSRSRTTADSDLYLFDRRTKTIRHLSPHEGAVSYVPYTFSHDGESLYYTTDEGSEFSYLVRRDLETGTVKEVLKPDWDVWSASFSKNGTYLAVTVNRDARTEVRVFHAETVSPVELPEPANAHISAVQFSRDESLMAFYAASSRAPEDLFVYDFSGSEPTRLTRSLNPQVEVDDLVKGEIVRFESHDGVVVPGILYKPHAVTPANPAAALVLVHGGPGGQSKLDYDPLIQYLVHHGYVVFAINHRGSSGYGKTFYGMDDRRHGVADLDDCVASKRMLIDTGYVDSRRIGIMGRSYGGFMTLAALAFRPLEFQAGVDLFGISNWVRTLESLPLWWQPTRQALIAELGDPLVDRELLEAKSPLFHAAKIVRPLMVLQGADDSRVLKSESDELVRAVRAHGVPVEYLVFDGEGHGLAGKENRRQAYEAILRFLEEHLRPAE